MAQALGGHIIYHPSQDLLSIKSNLLILISGHRNKPGHSCALSTKEYLRINLRKVKISSQKRGMEPKKQKH